MDWSIAALLAQDGVVTGAIYALLGLALILVYSVTRVPFIPMGGFVTYSALSLNMMQNGKAPSVAALLLVLGVGCFILQLLQAKRQRTLTLQRILGWATACLVAPLLLCVAAVYVPWTKVPGLLQMAFVLLITVPLAPMIYRLAFQPIQDAGVLVMFMVAVSIDAVIVGMALLLFGPDGVRNEAYSDFSMQLGNLVVTGHSLWTIGVTILLVVLLYGFFYFSLEGKKLRATAVNRVGAQLVGISTSRAGMLAFGLAAAIGAICGILIGPTTTLNSSSGVLIGLKGFVAAVIGGFASYPIAAIGAIAVGVLESFSSFWASAWKDAIVFTLIVPVLLVRSLSGHHPTDDH
ncbi:branched-chain amino acid ABC transporter permease [Hydrogenophaga sp. YM1]|uniref:branched-chain amino acid ABC transporter permease n=1 Tax=Hydrogenophaga sp. YM1 TaxID=2806262 RepID=UPI00195EE259|nr:branched-chain amino acid ABC transporter permease [Hydrogenophaga sp. YM1]QRR35602.1 branched-chain amino acid ABC transporter permease [Hydrogenophaga sp. YM1]